MTVGQFKACAKGFQERLEREARLQDQLNHTLGKYVAIGVNNPEKYPLEPFMAEKRKTKMMSFDKFEELARKKYGKK